MKYLVDANLSHRVAELLRTAGHDATAVREVGLQTASDDQILDLATAHEFVVVSNDSDFGTLLVARLLHRPSFVLLRSSDPLTPDDQAALLIAKLAAITEELQAGAIVVFARNRLRVRRLPL